MLLEPILYDIGSFLVVENIRGIMNRGLNIVVIVLVLASISVGGVSGETSSGIELSEEEIRMVSIGQIDRSDFVVQTPNLATSISMDRKIILGELNKYILEERISSASGEDEKREILFQAATDVEIESADITDRFVEIRERWKSGWIGSEEFTRELMLISTDSKVLGGLLDHIEEESEMVSQMELRGRIMMLKEELIPFEGPVKKNLIDVARGEREVGNVYIAASKSGVVLATIEGSTYWREAYVWDQESLLGGISLDEAITRTASLYPIAYNPEVSRQTGIMGKGRGYQIEIGFDSGSLIAYLDGGTKNVFYEIQERKLGITGLGARDSRTIGSLDGGTMKVAVARSFVGGPLKVEVYDIDTGNSIASKMLIGTSREEEINRGGTWILAPPENTKIVFQREDGEVLEIQILPIPINEVKNEN
tara:strand:+ start:4624 stop:5892 length:1269 start_codon:yes stop_codon:yes gene_type:complete